MSGKETVPEVWNAIKDLVTVLRQTSENGEQKRLEEERFEQQCLEELRKPKEQKRLEEQILKEEKLEQQPFDGNGLDTQKSLPFWSTMLL